MIVLTFPAPAIASHSDFIDPDNVDHYIDRNSVTTRASDATVHAIGQLNRSKMNATLSGSGDVEVYDAYDGTTGSWNNTLGRRTTCVNKTWTGWECDVYELRYNLSYMAGTSRACWSSLGCHEFGHTAGLSHRYASTDSDDNSCLRSDIDPTTFDAHDLNVINDDV